MRLVIWDAIVSNYDVSVMLMIHKWHNKTHKQMRTACIIFGMYLVSLHKFTSKGLTHWGRVTHICVIKLAITGPDNDLSPGRRQAIIWTNAGILLIRTLETNFSEILIKINTFSFKKMHMKMSSGKRQPFCLGLNVLSVASRYEALPTPNENMAVVVVNYVLCWISW